MKHLLKCLIFLSIAFFSENIFASDYSWDMTSGYPPTSQQGLTQTYFAKAVESKTNNQIKITNHFSASLGYKGIEIFDAVSDGTVAGGFSYIGMLGGVNPIFLLSSLPFLATNYEDCMQLWKISERYYQKVMKDNNQILLYVFPNPPNGIWAKKNIQTKEDLKNLKIRTYDPSGTITFKNIGAAPVQLTWADLMTQLSAGAVDAVLTSAESGRSGKLWEFLNFYNEIGYVVSLNMAHMNADKFNQLSSELREKVLEAAKEASEVAWKESKERIESNHKILKENSVKIVDNVPKELINQLEVAGKQAIADWQKEMGPDGKKIVKEYEKLKLEKK